MANKQAPAPVSLAASKRAQRAPSKGTVVKPAAPAPAPVQAAAPAPAPVQAAPAPAPVVAVRGGLAIASVKLTGKVYRVGAAHNQAWWQQCQQAVVAGGGTASVAALMEAGVPAIFVGYVVRRGYMAAA